MSNTKFTKGPWVTIGVGDTTYVDDKHGFTVAQVIDCEGVIENAPLIAAAPDMYVMIKELACMMDKLNEGFNADHKAIELSVRAENLLTKARGEL